MTLYYKNDSKSTLLSFEMSFFKKFANISVNNVRVFSWKPNMDWKTHLL